MGRIIFLAAIISLVIFLIIKYKGIIIYNILSLISFVCGTIADIADILCGYINFVKKIENLNIVYNDMVAKNINNKEDIGNYYMAASYELSTAITHEPYHVNADAILYVINVIKPVLLPAHKFIDLYALAHNRTKSVETIIDGACKIIGCSESDLVVSMDSWIYLERPSYASYNEDDWQELLEEYDYDLYMDNALNEDDDNE